MCFRQSLRATTGTVITPLAERVGPVINLLGTLLVTLSLGLTAIQVALAQYSVEERLPRRGSASFVGRLHEWPRFALAVSPMLLILLLAEWLAMSGTSSFASLLGILGALLLPLLIGILPDAAAGCGAHTARGHCAGSVSDLVGASVAGGAALSLLYRQRVNAWSLYLAGVAAAAIGHWQQPGDKELSLGRAGGGGSQPNAL
ncbi:MAG: hypothetical protein R2932_39565 [Caldilineaceae bacterium]